MDHIEHLLTSVFLVDFCIRIYAAKSAMRYIFSFKGLLDFVSVVPGIVLAVFETIDSAYDLVTWHQHIPLWTFSFARAMRVLGILKLLKHIVKQSDSELEEYSDPVEDSQQFIAESNGDDRDCCSCKFWILSEVAYYRMILVSHLLMLFFVGAGLFAIVEGPTTAQYLPVPSDYVKHFVYLKPDSLISTLMMTLYF